MFSPKSEMQTFQSNKIKMNSGPRLECLPGFLIIHFPHFSTVLIYHP